MKDGYRQKPIPSPAEFISGAVQASPLFPGFKHLTANFTYTPNQFFDVCLPNYSRGAVRLVAYMIRQTLGYCDADGRPLVQRVAVSYRELEKFAGISHSTIRSVIDEALAGKFITCTQVGTRNQNGKRYTNAEFELRWHDSPEYVKDPKKFKGFFGDEGNRTDIPNQYFDVTIPNESLSVIKVVGSVLRFSVGYQTRQGGRRQQVALSYNDIQNYARIGGRRHLSAAIQEALETGYIVRVRDGFFDPNNGKRSEAGTYAIKWESVATYSANTPKKEPGKTTARHTEKGTGNTPKREPGKHTEKGTDIQTKASKTLKQQQRPTAVAVEDFEAFQWLAAVGFDQATAIRLSVRPVHEVKQQVEWLPTGPQVAAHIEASAATPPRILRPAREGAYLWWAEAQPVSGGALPLTRFATLRNRCPSGASLLPARGKF